MVTPITGELVVTSASGLRWKTRAFMLVVFLLGCAGGYSLFKYQDGRMQNVRLDARFVELNNSYSKRISHLDELIKLFDEQFFDENAYSRFADRQQIKLDEYKTRLQEHKRKVEVEQVAYKIRLLASNVSRQYSYVIADSIHAWAEPYGNDPDMLVALAYVESHFEKKRVSDKGAIGLTQVMPSWIQCNYPKIICNELRFIKSKEELAENDDKNIRAGSAILSFMLQKADGRWDQALASYDMGRVKGGANNAGKAYDLTYAKKVLGVYTRLKQMESQKAALLKKRSAG